MWYLQVLPRYPSALHMLIHELLQVIVQELKHEEELAVTVEHLQEADNVGMVQLLEQGDLSNGRGWDAFTFTAEERKTLPEWEYCYYDSSYCCFLLVNPPPTLLNCP